MLTYLAAKRVISFGVEILVLVVKMAGGAGSDRATSDVTEQSEGRSSDDDEVCSPAQVPKNYILPRKITYFTVTS